jgi:D-threo-aldose 1-dehydrogenase
MDSKMTELRQLGASNVRLPLLGFGGAALGNLYRPVPDQVAREAITAALDLGFRYFDTAPHYGFGLSERRIGSALSHFDSNRDTIISTKVGRLLVPLESGRGDRHGYVDAAAFEPVFDYSYDAVLRSWEESKARLQRDYVHILYAHDLGTVTHGDAHAKLFSEFMSGGYRAMRELKEAGEIGAIGIGANEWQICEQAMREGEFDAFLLAGRYTLLEQTALDTFFPECARRNVAVVVGGPYNSGILAAGTKSDRTLYFDYKIAPPEVIEHVRQLEAACVEFDVELAAAALQFPVRHPQVASVIPGQANAREVAETIRLFDADIPEHFWVSLKSKGLLRADAP